MRFLLPTVVLASALPGAVSFGLPPEGAPPTVESRGEVQRAEPPLRSRDAERLAGYATEFLKMRMTEADPREQRARFDLPTVSARERREVEALVEWLGHSDWEAREMASARGEELMRDRRYLENPAFRRLFQEKVTAAAKGADPEIRRRAERLAKRIDRRPSVQLRIELPGGESLPLPAAWFVRGERAGKGDLVKLDGKHLEQLRDELIQGRRAGAVELAHYGYAVLLLRTGRAYRVTEALRTENEKSSLDTFPEMARTAVETLNRRNADRWRRAAPGRDEEPPVHRER